MAGEPRLTDTQHQILVALCRPCAGGSRYATPATNQEIAAEVYLSVDAVKAHLRAIYRKFGIEPLPHNQKRARLVELVLEGGHVSPAPLPPPRAATPPPRAATPASPSGRSRRLLIGLAALLVLAATAVALADLLAEGDSDGAAPEAPTRTEYVAAVNGYCALALGALGAERPGASTAALAQDYLGVIETMNGRLDDLGEPPGPNRALERFRAGLRRAADFTSVVAQHPPDPGSAAGANVVAELTFAAGQVQAGALGYDLGPGCTAVGNLVARSARNAAGYP